MRERRQGWWGCGDMSGSQWRESGTSAHMLGRNLECKQSMQETREGVAGLTKAKQKANNSFPFPQCEDKSNT